MSPPDSLRVFVAFGAIMLLILVAVVVYIQFGDLTFTKWIGWTESELVSEKGLPQWVGFDRENRRILVYERVSDSDEAIKIRHRVVYIPEGGVVTADSSMLPAGHK
jgi:hypothetical protein